MADFDFGFGSSKSSDTTASSVNSETNDNLVSVEENAPVAQTDDVSEITNETQSQQETNQEENPNLSTGSVIEIDNVEYTIDKDGNLVDNKGTVFKKANEVESYLKGLEQVDNDGIDSNEINVGSIQKLFGVDVTDEKGNVIDFSNEPDGVQKYVAAATEQLQNEAANAAIYGFFSRYPAMQDAYNYYIANGNSFDGFGDQNSYDYDIEIDDNNVEQQENIIKLVWKEQNRKGDVDGYINYLKANNNLLDVAKEEFEQLKQQAKDYKQAQAEQAQQIELQRQQESAAYWNAVKGVIDNKVIAGYKIPDTIVVNRDGKKHAATPNDFFNYLYLVDNDGNSQYEIDIYNQDANTRIQNDILRAYLTFTGGDYSSLVNMAINKKEVQSYRTKATQQKKQTYRVKTPASKSNANTVDFGY